MISISAKMDIAGVTRFSRQLDSQSQEDLPSVVKDIAKKALEKVVERMPVATGRARAGWNDAGLALGVDVPEAIAGASAADDSDYSESWEGNSRFVVEMVNRVPYIVFLEYGSSAQAPLGMVRISLAELNQDLDAGQLEQTLREHWQALGQSERFQEHAIQFQNLVNG